MFSVKQKRQIADAVQQILRETNHPELPVGEISFHLHVDGAESWSWAVIENNGAVTNPGVNPWNEAQAHPSTPQPVAVSERPWEREGWCDEQGRCWLRRKHEEDGVTWRLMAPASVFDDAMQTYYAEALPARALLDGDPMPEGLTDKELVEHVRWFADEACLENSSGDIADSCRELIARWGRPTPQSEPEGRSSDDGYEAGSMWAGHPMQTRFPSDGEVYALSSCIVELKCRIEALEAAQPAHVNYAPVKPEHQDKLDRLIEQDRSDARQLTLVERVANAIDEAPTEPEGWSGEARAAIRVVAAAALQIHPDPNVTWERVALWIEQEANR